MSQQARTSAPIAASTATHFPEFFRLPARGGDPFFGLSRSFYYAAEREGLLNMVRVRTPGKLRGPVLVPFASVREFISKQGSMAPSPPVALTEGRRAAAR